MTKAQRNVEENLDDKNVNPEEEGRRSRTGSQVGSGSEVVRVESGGGCRRMIHPVPKGYLWCGIQPGLLWYTFGVQVLRGGTGASGEHGVHGVPRWICYDRKDGTDGDETKWKQLSKRQEPR